MTNKLGAISIDMPISKEHLQATQSKKPRDIGYNSDVEKRETSIA